MINKIAQIFKTGRKLDIIECGCGAVISNTLLSIPDSSSFINKCIQPYSKESQFRMLGFRYSLFMQGSKRCVSKELVDLFLNKPPEDLDIDRLCLSFQISKDGSQTHGWIGLKINKSRYFYHISFNTKFSDTDLLEDKVEERRFYLNKISEVTVNILYKHYIDNSFSLKNNYIDDLSSYEDKEGDELFKILGESDSVDSFVVYENNERKRMEEICRNYDGLILMRGSFNPIHYGHLDMVKKAKEKYPTYKVCFLISLNRRDKPLLTSEECKEKIKKISEYGYPIIFSSNPFFSQTIMSLRQRWNLPIIFPVGMDTINRFIDDEINQELKMLNKTNDIDNYLSKNEALLYIRENWKNVKFLVFNRKDFPTHKYLNRYSLIIENELSYEDDGISSTKIRNNV